MAVILVARLGVRGGETHVFDANGPSGVRFTTQPIWRFRSDPPDFKFILGSCNYFNDAPYDRPGDPYGQDPAVFAPMGSSGADFMLWMGDNVYFREGDYTSRSGLWYRWRRDRAMPVLAPLLRNMPNYAIWDDHDYGTNDSGRSFRLKEAAL